MKPSSQKVSDLLAKIATSDFYLWAVSKKFSCDKKMVTDFLQIHLEERENNPLQGKA